MLIVASDVPPGLHHEIPEELGFPRHPPKVSEERWPHVRRVSTPEISFCMVVNHQLFHGGFAEHIFNVFGSFCKCLACF